MPRCRRVEYRTRPAGGYVLRRGRVDGRRGLGYRAVPLGAGRGTFRWRQRYIAGQGGPTMAMITDASLAMETEAEGLAFAREVLRIEAEALERVRDRLGVSIARAAALLFRCPGS